MMINQQIEKALNKQINAELNAFYSYLSMAAFFEFNYLPGFAHWFRAQSNEEFNHAMKLNNYIISRGGKVVLTAIEAPKIEWDSYLSVLEEAYAQELKISSLINDLLDLAKSQKDYATEIMLQWFVVEQVEEEETADNNVERLKSIKNAADEMAIFDRELGQRK